MKMNLKRGEHELETMFDEVDPASPGLARTVVEIGTSSAFAGLVSYGLARLIGAEDPLRWAKIGAGIVSGLGAAALLVRR